MRDYKLYGTAEAGRGEKRHPISNAVGIILSLSSDDYLTGLYFCRSIHVGGVGQCYLSSAYFFIAYAGYIGYIRSGWGGFLIGIPSDNSNPLRYIEYSYQVHPVSEK
jgi:hypothetical protein